MHPSRTRLVSGQIRQLLADHATSALSDQDLVQRYVLLHDEEAFASLVRRHGPLVQRVCQGLLSQRQDAEDVVQATFLVLARKAGSIRKQASVGSWLYGVAYRLARKAASQATKTTPHRSLSESARSPNPLDELTCRELHEALYEELDHLPDRYRAPLLLCYWEGMTHEEAADQLGWKKGAVKNRLERGRALLRGRLLRRGLSLSLVLPTVLLAPVPASARWGDIGPLLGSSVPSRATALADGFIRGLALARLRAVVCWLLVLSTVLTAAGWAGARALGPQEPGGPAAAISSESLPGAEVAAPTGDVHGDPLPAGAVARLGTLRLRHDHATGVGALAFSADGKLLASAGFDQTLRLWETATGKELARLKHGGMLHTLAFSPDGKTLAAAGGGDCLVRLWDVAGGKEIKSFAGHRSDVLTLAWSGNGKQLTSAGYEPTVRTWDVATGKEIAQVRNIGPVHAVTLSADGKTLAVTSAARDKEASLIRLWDVPRAKEVSRFAGHQRLVTALAFRPDGKVLAWGDGDRDCTVHLWDVVAGKETGQLKGQKEGVTYLAFAPDARTLVAASHNPFHTALWDLGSGQLRFTFEKTGGAVAFAPDGKTLALVGNGPAIRLVNPVTGKDRLALARHANPVLTTAFSPDGKVIVTHDSQTIFFWDRLTGQLLRQVASPSPFVAGLQVLPDGKVLVANAGSKAVRFWEATTQQEISRCEVDDALGPCTFSPDGKRAALAGFQSVCVVDVATGKTVHRFDETASWVTFSPDGKTLIAVKAAIRLGEQAALCRWDVLSGAEMGRLVGSGSYPRFSPDGALLVLRDGAGIHFRESAGNQQLFTVPLRGEDPELPKGLEHLAEKMRGSLVSPFALSSDGRLLATPDKSGTVLLWGLGAGHELARFRGHGARVNALAFSPDGRWLVSGSDDTTALVWDLTGVRGKLQPPQKDLSAREFAGLWEDIGSADGVTAYHAMVALIGGGDRAMAQVQERLQPIRPSQTARWIAELDHDEFKVRQAAIDALWQLGPAAKPALSKALDNNPSLDARRRIEEVLETIGKGRLHPEVLRGLRAIFVLEHLDSRVARQILEQLAGGAAEARLTQEARSALARLARR
jgi:RNA polymerase sigma factor (sigma-70 family)